MTETQALWLVGIQFVVLTAYLALDIWGWMINRETRALLREFDKPVCWKCCAEHEDSAP